MKKMSFVIGLALAVTVFGVSTANASSVDFGAAGAAADKEYTLEEMLQYAIEDEFLAQAEYEIIMEKYGTIRPFSNIIKAESRHISALLPLFEKYDLDVPVNDADERVVVPGSLSEIFSIGVEAEINNIEMYEGFLEEDLPDDVEFVFENLMRASENHLKAFERADERSTIGFDQRGRDNQIRGFGNRFGSMN